MAATSDYFNMSTTESSYSNTSIVTQTWGTELPWDLSNTTDNLTNITFIPTTGGRQPCGRLYHFMIECISMGLMCFFGFAGNILSMICLWRDKSKTATPFLLISLEVADTVFLVTVLLLRVVTSLFMYNRWISPIVYAFPYLGAYVYPVALVAEMGTIWITVLVTVNRYVSVCRPYEVSSWCSVQQARRQVIIIWILSLIFNLPRFFEFEVIDHPNPAFKMKTVRTTAFGNNKIYQILYGSILYCLMMFLVPLVTLILLNCRLIQGLQQTRLKRSQLLRGSESSGHSRSEEDITLMLIVVVLVFVLTQLPALLTQVLRVALPNNLRQCPYFYFYFERLSDMMVVLNSSINFIIYCFCSRKFRRILLSLVCKRAIGKKESPEQSQNGQTMCTYS